MLGLSAEAMDVLVQASTGWFSFAEMLDTEGRWGGYMPTIDGEDAASRLLADLYDAAQEQRGDPRRARRTQVPLHRIEVDFPTPSIIREIQLRRPVSPD